MRKKPNLPLKTNTHTLQTQSGPGRAQTGLSKHTPVEQRGDSDYRFMEDLWMY